VQAMAFAGAVLCSCCGMILLAFVWLIHEANKDRGMTMNLRTGMREKSDRYTASNNK